MIIKTGVDMAEIARVKKAMANPRFLTRFFGERERMLLAVRGNPPSSVAASFCAKEAFSKAMGTGVRGFRLKDIELLRDGNGKPFLAFSGKAAEIVRTGGWQFDVSVTHTKELAAVVVTAYRD